MYKCQTNNQEFQLSSDDIKASDLVVISDDEISIISNHQSHQIKCISEDLENKKYQVEINGEIFHVNIEDEYDQLVEQLGFSREEVKIIKDVKAPMPGLLLELLVKAGDTIDTGTPLLILEAMKMENVIKAQGAGVIKHILVKQSTAVEKGQVLIEME